MASKIQIKNWIIMI